MLFNKTSHKNHPVMIQIFVINLKKETKLEKNVDVLIWIMYNNNEIFWKTVSRINCF